MTTWPLDELQKIQDRIDDAYRYGPGDQVMPHVEVYKPGIQKYSENLCKKPGYDLNDL